ncbi:MAG: shikimate kinase [Planctomycetota bacterium]|nr:shikimate kinase [Planctomycetota bacterium]
MAPSKLLPRLLLIGYRGTGKTTVATHLAKKTASQWIDTDNEIVRRAACSIETIFEREGEIGFRDRETFALRSVLEQSVPIIACGGGIVLRKENRQLLQSAGTTVLLEASPKTIAARLDHDHQTVVQRPPLTNLSPQEEITTILADRMARYRQCANIIVDTETKTAEQVAEEIIAHWHP